MWCLSFVLRNKGSCSSGASRRCGSSRERQEGRTIHNVQRPVPFRTISSVRRRAPLRIPGGQGPRQSDKTQRRPIVRKRARSDCGEVCRISSITRWNRTQWQERKTERRKEKISVKPLWVLPSKNICRGREDRKEQREEKGEEENRPFTTLKRKRLWSEREKIFTQGISSGSLCACRALVPWLHFRAQVAQLELPPGQA